jgi:hypothetical protein
MEWSEYVDEVMADGLPDNQYREGYDWQGFNTWEDLRTLAVDGYHVDVDVEHLLSWVETDLGTGEMESFSSTFDVAGDEVDIARFIDGEPENMMTSQIMKVMKTGRVISLYVPIAISSTVKAEEILARGRAILTLVELFKRKQHPLEIWAVDACNGMNDSNDNYKRRACVVIKVQAADQPLDDGRVMFALAHPGMLRGLGFKYRDITSVGNAKVREVWGSGEMYGRPSFSVEDQDIMSDHEHSIVLPPLNTHLDYGNNSWQNDKFAGQWIEAMLQLIEQGA